jgi:hypothetical protein
VGGESDLKIWGFLNKRVLNFGVMLLTTFMRNFNFNNIISIFSKFFPVPTSSGLLDWQLIIIFKFYALLMRHALRQVVIC